VIYAIPFDPNRLDVSARSRPIIDGVLGDSTTGAAFYAVSDSGTLAYVPGDASTVARRLVWTDLGGTATAIDLPPALYGDLHASPDGTRLAASVVVPGSGSRDVWVAEPARGTSTRLTSQGENWTPIWSHDGKRIFYVWYDGEHDRSRFEVRAADGGGVSTEIGVFAGRALLQGATPDDATLYLCARPSNATQDRLYRLASTVGASSQPTEVPVPASSTNPWVADVSPDGRWLAYAAIDAGREQVFVQSVDPGSGRVQLSTDTGSKPRWSPDGQEVYFVRNDELFAVSFDAKHAVGIGRPRRLFGGVVGLPIESGQTYDVDHRRGRFLMLRATERPPVAEVRFILNWASEVMGQIGTR
jgi:dipeptidyl aminopeptidase/acylaminoacyl peptidase